MLNRLLAAIGLAEPIPEPTDKGDDADAIVHTSMGSFEVALFDNDAPKTVAAWRENAAYFDGSDGDGATVFHRVIAGFMVQCGGHRPDGSKKPPRPSLPNEAKNGHRNVRGTLAMARRDDPDSASSQWFVNVVDNGSLDPGAFSAGYTVFGRVVAGMDVVDAISNVQTQAGDVPVEVITIERIEFV